MPENAVETGSETVRLVNRRDQPVELHCGAEVVVVPPLGSVVLPATLLATPQIDVLIRRRVLVMRAVSPDAGNPTDQAEPQRARRRR